MRNIGVRLISSFDTVAKWEMPAAAFVVLAPGSTCICCSYFASGYPVSKISQLSCFFVFPAWIVCFKLLGAVRRYGPTCSKFPVNNRNFASPRRLGRSGRNPPSYCLSPYLSQGWTPPHWLHYRSHCVLPCLSLGLGNSNLPCCYHGSRRFHWCSLAHI